MEGGRNRRAMFDVEKFIAMVEERPALYDPRVQEYSSRDVKSRCWWEIGSQVYDNWDMLNVREKYDKGESLVILLRYGGGLLNLP